MNIQLIAEQIGRIHLTLETTDAFEVYGGTWLGAFEVSQTGTAQWTLTVREQLVAAAPLRDYKVYARQLATGREWEVLSGKILVSARTAAVPADKLAPVEYFVTVPVVDHDVDAVGSTIVQGIPGPKGDKGDPGPPGEGGMTDEERAKLAGAAQRDAANTFTASNTFTGEVDMSNAQVTPPSGWNVEGVTAEQVQAVVPMAWGRWNATPTATSYLSFALGSEANAADYSTALGSNAAATSRSLAVGYKTKSTGRFATAMGNTTEATAQVSITLGAAFEDTAGSYTCTTEGTGSITIGAGANTLNNGDVESSNSVTIGCKASNSGADSVVIGAQASTSTAGAVVIGASTSGEGVLISSHAEGSSESVSVGKYARGTGATTLVGHWADGRGAFYAVGVGYQAKTATRGVAIGSGSHAAQRSAIAIGDAALSNDIGAVVIRSTASDGTYTQLYFSGAGTPLANTYENGAPMLGYVTKDSAGNIVAAGTRSLIELLTNNSTFAPASLDENGEWVMPRVFHPSDLDMPQEEPQEPEEYQPLPVYPIVEPELEDLPPHSEVENS